MQPAIKARRLVPTEAVEIVANRMERAFHRALIDGLMHLILSDLRHSEMLQPFLKLRHVRITNGPWERSEAGAFAVAIGSGARLIAVHDISS